MGQAESFMLLRLFLFFTTVALLAVAQAPQMLSLDQIISKHLAALGGVDNVKSIRATKTTGKMLMGGEQGEASMIAWSLRPAKQRLEIIMQGQKIIQAYDGKTAWMINPMSGSPDPQRMPDEETRAATVDTDPDGSPLIDYQAKGNKVELVGKDDVQGSTAYKLRVTLKSGVSSFLFLDEKTFLPSKTITKAKQMGQDLEVETYPSNYQAVNGVMMPFANEVKVGGRSMVRNVIEKIEANVPIDDALFAIPPPAPRPTLMPPRPQVKQD
jgi:outer membrane lipoprotein-sorting protein